MHIRLRSIPSAAAISALALTISMPAFASDKSEKSADNVEAVEGTEVARECLQDLRELNSELTESSYTTSAMRRDMRELRDAAVVLAENGREDACETVVSQMRELAEDHEERVEAQREDEDRAKDRQERLSTVQKLTQTAGTVGVAKIIGTDIQDPNGETLGEIEDVFVSAKKGNVSYVLIGRGGFLGLAEDHVAVRWQDLRASNDLDTIVLNTTTEKLEAAPKLDQASSDPNLLEEWGGRVDQYWDEHIKE